MPAPPRYSLLTMALLLGCLAARPAHALATETFGNAPLSDANYRDWPQLMPVINHTARVYSYWVNGNERFFFKGDTTALNQALKDFAGVKAGVLEVVPRPGPGNTATLSREKTIDYNWELQLIGGIARHLTTLPQGTEIWRRDPVLTIRTGGAIDLAKLEIPAGVRLLTIADLKQRATGAIARSTDQSVRGWGCGELAAYDPYDDASRATLVGMLKDPVSWVRLCAARALSSLGSKALPEVPQLRAALEGADDKLREQLNQAITAIETAPARPAQETAFREQAAVIAAFADARRKSPTSLPSIGAR